RCGLFGVAVNQDGRSSTLTAPNGPSQATVMRVALAEAKLAPEEVVHMECHGTGTPLGDPIEIGGLKSINASRTEDRPLILAAVKSNCGHLEGPAASTGLIKSVALMEHLSSMSSIHLCTLNPSIAALSDLPALFATESLPMASKVLSRLGGGLSSFGFGGTNA
ncbi:Phenolphthiocerol/phthiocerol polyketide synthase subunit A ((Phenol)carboxyphthiodiolenone synthase subunit A) (Beta-ketoacyl-acyl-carrier-protein synthase I) (Phthiocerol synthesis polyketide synthase type I PpsA), partial [Durusdinium trenchii]